MNDLVPYISAVVSKVCGDGRSLTQGSSYPVIQMSDTDYRVIDDRGEPSLYPRSYFLEDRLEPSLVMDEEPHGNRMVNSSARQWCQEPLQQTGTRTNRIAWVCWLNDCGLLLKQTRTRRNLCPAKLLPNFCPRITLMNADECRHEVVGDFYSILNLFA